MRVTVDLSMVERVFDYLTVSNFEDGDGFKSLIDDLIEMESFQKMLQFYEGVFDQATYSEILYLALNDLDYVSENESLMILYTNLKRLREIERVRCKMELVQHYDFNLIQRRLIESLPINVEVEVNIVLLFDGINGGSILGQHDLLLNIMLWPSDIKNLHLIEGILLHEFHHVGLKTLFKNESYLIENKLSDKDTSKYILTAIMSEGAATYFFNEGHDLYPLIVESHGRQYADLYHESMQMRSLQMAELIFEFQEDIKSLLSNTSAKESNIKLISKYCYSSDGVEPRDKAIGYQMCKAIDMTHGREKLIETMRSPLDFLTTYSKIERLDLGLMFSEVFVDLYSTMWRGHEEGRHAV